MGADAVGEASPAMAAGRPPTYRQYKQAQVTITGFLAVLFVLGHLVLDQTTSFGNRIFMPILTVSAPQDTSGCVGSGFLTSSPLPKVMLTSANEMVHGMWETSKVSGGDDPPPPPPPPPRRSRSRTLERADLTSLQPAQEGGLARRAAVSVAAGTFFFCFAATCFGVPIRSLLDTANLGFFFSTLVAMPGACLLTEDLGQWKRSYATMKPQNTAERVCSELFLCSIAGSWLGAWVVPLDWNASWQRWPIPCFLGAVAGNLAGSAWVVRWLGRAQHKQEEQDRRRRKYESGARQKKLKEGAEDAPVCNESNWWMFM